MPLPSEAQNFMPLFAGLTNGIDDKGRIGPLAAILRTIAKIANYTALPAESGTIFTTLGATGAVVITLPPVASSAGCIFGFFNAVDQNCGVAAPAGTLVYDNNAAATSLTWSTVSHKIGGAALFICDGTKWYALVAVNGAAAPTVA